MLFAEEQKALNFIKFNRGVILDETGKAPSRAYYCPYCLGWHVTSCESEEVGKRLDQKDKAETERAMRARAFDLELESLADLIRPRLYRAVAKALLGEELLAKAAFEECEEWISLMREKAPFSKVPIRLLEQFRQLRKWTGRIQDGLLLTPEVRLERMENPCCKTNQRLVYIQVGAVERVRLALQKAKPSVKADPKLLGKWLSPFVNALTGEYSGEIRQAIFEVLEELHAAGRVED